MTGQDPALTLGWVGGGVLNNQREDQTLISFKHSNLDLNIARVPHCFSSNVNKQKKKTPVPSVQCLLPCCSDSKGDFITDV